MNEVFDFTKVHQITQNVDYAYSFNDKSLVFSLRPPSVPIDSLSIDKFNCIYFCIFEEKKILSLFFKNSKLTNISKVVENDFQLLTNDSNFITSLAITDDSLNAIVGRNDGSLSVINLKAILEKNIKNSDTLEWSSEEIKLTSNNHINYKFIHQNEITNMAFLNGNKRVIIGDCTGMITLLSFLNSFTCELVVQTTIVNLKMPFTMFEVFPEDNIFAFSSPEKYSVLKTGRRIEVLLCSDKDEISDVSCCSIEKFYENGSELICSSFIDKSKYSCLKDKNSKNRILICKNRSLFVYDIETEDNQKIEWSFEIPDENQPPSPIIKCFIVNHFFFLLLFKNGEGVIIKDKTAEIVQKIVDLPTNVNPSRIQLMNNVLIYFLKSDIVQKVIDFPIE